MFQVLKRKIGKRVNQPFTIPAMANIKYDLKKNWKGFRKRTEQYGEPIDCNGADHIHNYMTVFCNLECSFCINRQIAKVYPRFDKHDWQEWATVLNRMYNFRELYFNGGEHFILPYFADFINMLDGHNILLFTNYPKKEIDQVKKLNKNNNILMDVSYSVYEDGSVSEFVERLREIPKHINWTVHIINRPEVHSIIVADAFRRYGINPVVQDAVYYPELAEEATKEVNCNSKEHIIGPDMKVYRCVVQMLYGIPGIDIEQYDWEFGFHPCGLYPRCKIACGYAEIKECKI